MQFELGIAAGLMLPADDHNLRSDVAAQHEYTIAPEVALRASFLPVKYLGGPLMSVGAPDQGTVLARYVGGEEAVLSGLMRGAAEIRQRPFAIDVAGGFSGKGRVILFSNNPIYRWQNHGEFNMVFNAMMNWNDLGGSGSAASSTSSSGGGRN